MSLLWHGTALGWEKRAAGGLTVFVQNLSPSLPLLSRSHCHHTPPHPQLLASQPFCFPSPPVFDLFSLIIDLKFFDLAQANLTPNYGFNHPINIQQNRLGVLFICYKFCLISIVQWHFINMKTNKLDTQNWANAMQIKLMVSGGLILWGS